MVHYIRFLKSARIVRCSSGSTFVEALVTITTDLGDSLLLADATLTASLVAVDNPTRILATDRISWHRGQRERGLSLPLPEHAARGGADLRLRVSHATANDSIPSILGVWSAPLMSSFKAPVASIVERTISLPPLRQLNVWEESGTSLSAHIWDAALGCLLCFQGILASGGRMGVLEQIILGHHAEQIEILELGAGCGVVGIAIATWFRNCKVQLTDQADAQDLLWRNLKHASPAQNSTLLARTVDWYAKPEAESLERHLDLVVVSDCIYNADSCPALVDILTQLSTLSPKVKILVARKRRHDSEEVFFQLMQEARMPILEQTTIELADETPDMTGEPPLTEFYLYGSTGPV